MISAIVLAAGSASRFGATKQLAVVRGRPLVQHAIDAAGSVVDEIVVVLGHDAVAVHAALALPPSARVVVNHRYAEGQSTSLATGLAACAEGSSGAIVLLGDQPGIREDHVRALAEAFGGGGTDVLRVRFRDGPGPVLLPRSMWAELSELEGDVGARVWLEAHPDRVRSIDLDEPAPKDVDLPEDLTGA